MKNKTAAIILAAGEGKRMHSDLPKVCHPVVGQPMLSYPVDLCRQLNIDPIVVVISGHRERAKKVRHIFEDASKNSPKNLNDIRFATQDKQLGTAHAVAKGLIQLKGFQGTVLILYGDVPLLQKETIDGFLKKHRQNKFTVSLISMTLPNPKGYGRIIREKSNGHFPLRIIEERDANAQEKKIHEVNAGIYAVEGAFLSAALPAIGAKNAQKEYYLTDLLTKAQEEKKKAYVYHEKDYEEFLGVNTQEELMNVERLAREKNVMRFQKKGVRIIDPQTTYIEAKVQIAKGVTIFPGCTILGKTRIGEGATLGPNVYLEDTQVDKNARIKPFSVLEESIVGPDAIVGPFAHLRPGAVLKKGAKVGNFVEMKKATLGPGAKANHLSYIGDTEVGANANIGAGTITCNYDGYKKSQTKIGEGAFIGSDSQLIAPVTIGKNAIVGAGTTVTKDVPAGALALSRPPQENKKGWATRKHEINKRKKKK